MWASSGVPTTVLRKDGPLTEEEFAAIQLHPMRGLEIVQEIGFLGEALAGIMHGTRPRLPEQLQWRIQAAQRRHHRPVRHRSRAGCETHCADRRNRHLPQHWLGLDTRQPPGTRGWA